VTGHPPVPDGLGEAVLPPGAGCQTQAAEAVETTGVGGAEAIASLTEAAASPPEATGCLEEAARTEGEGVAGPSELLMRIRFSTNFVSMREYYFSAFLKKKNKIETNVLSIYLH
jgi:hypothetical protein